jgi:DNA-binding beta-propeller fold protein YncE
VAVTPDGLHAYVTNQCDNTVSVIDTAAHWLPACGVRNADHNPSIQVSIEYKPSEPR